MKKAILKVPVWDQGPVVKSPISSNLWLTLYFLFLPLILSFLQNEESTTIVRPSQRLINGLGSAEKKVRAL